MKRSRSPLLVLALILGCGGKVFVDRSGESAGGVGGGGGATAGASGASSAGASTGGGGSAVDAGTQCRCKGQPDYAPCVLPLMCCPCADHCQDPATFNCSCPTIPPCP